MDKRLRKRKFQPVVSICVEIVKRERRTPSKKDIFSLEKKKGKKLDIIYTTGADVDIVPRREFL